MNCKLENDMESKDLNNRVIRNKKFRQNYIYVSKRIIFM